MSGHGEKVETVGGGVLVEYVDTDPEVVHDDSPGDREEHIRRRSTTVLEQYLDAGYFNADTERLVRAELARRKNEQPPAA